MYRIEDIAFDDYYVKSVELDLESCDIYLKVIFHKDNNRIERRKTYKFETDCNVDINKLIDDLKTIIV